MPEDDRTDDLVRLVDDESASRVAGERASRHGTSSITIDHTLGEECEPPTGGGNRTGR